MAPLGAVPSVTESLVSSGTTAGGLPCVQRSAAPASKRAKRATATGYAGFKPRQTVLGIISSSLAAIDTEPSSLGLRLERMAAIISVRPDVDRRWYCASPISVLGK